MVTRTAEKISDIPGELLAPSPGVLQTLGGKGLRDRWLQTRPRNTNELMENPSSERFFPGIGQPLIGFMAQHDELQ